MPRSVLATIFVGWLLGLASFVSGCGQGDTATVGTSETANAAPSGDAVAPGSATSQNTQTPASARSPAARIGRPLVTIDDYRPVTGRYGGRIVRDTLGEPKSFNPVTSQETSTSEYTNRMFEGLVQENPFTGEFDPILAEAWDVAEDGVTWTFRLRQYVVFNDGTPLTAHDVAFTWNDLVYDSSRPNPDSTEPRWPSSTRDVSTFAGQRLRVEAVDDRTVRVTTPFPLAITLNLMTTQVLPRAKYAPMVANGTFGGAMAADSRPGDIVGTGPWVLGSYSRGANVRLVRNPRYWKRDSAGNALPYLDELVFTVTPDLNQMYLRFRRGETDSYGVTSGQQIPPLRQAMERENFQLYNLGPSYGTEFLSFNMNGRAVESGALAGWKAETFRDSRFRRAVSHAIDRQALVRGVLHNLGQPQAAPFTSAPSPFTVEGIDPLAYDPRRARSLLAEVGLQDRNGNGYLQDAQGRELSVTLLTNSGNTNREQMLDFIRKDLENVGIRANLLLLEFNNLVDRLDNSYNWEAMLMGFTGGREPNDGANFWKSSSNLHMWWPKQQTPFFEWERRIDELFEAGVRELDPERRRAIYREWIEIVHAEQPVIYLTNPVRVAAVRDRFGNVFPSPLGLFHNEEEIFVRP